MMYDEVLVNLQDLINRIPTDSYPGSVAIRDDDRETLQMARQLLIVRANIIDDDSRIIDDQSKRIDDKSKRIDELNALLASKRSEVNDLMDTRVDLNEVQAYIYKARYALEMVHQAALDEMSLYLVARRIIDDIREQFSPDRSDMPF